MGIEKRRSTLSVLFYIKRQKLLKNGEAPVCMRITVDKRKAEIVIKRSVPVELWNQSKECSKGKDRSSQELNHYINSVRARVLQIHRELEIDGKSTACCPRAPNAVAPRGHLTIDPPGQNKNNPCQA